MGIVSNGVQIMKIFATIASLFNLNAAQQAELNNYVKYQQYQWIEQRRTEAEVEQMIRSEAQLISGK